jgi:hypothetical protein
MSTKKDLTKIGVIVDNLEGQFRLRDKAREYQALKQWKDIVGERIAEHSRPLYIAENHLFVKTDGSVWSQEISFLKNEILKNINDFLGFQAVKDIRYKVE